MPRDFRNFINNQNSNSNNFNSQKTNSQTTSEKTLEYEEILNKYKDMNQSDLMSNLFNEANKLKQEGKLDANSLESLKTTLSPYLNPEQQNMLDSIIKSIK